MKITNLQHMSEHISLCNDSPHIVSLVSKKFISQSPLYLPPPPLPNPPNKKPLIQSLPDFKSENWKPPKRISEDKKSLKPTDKTRKKPPLYPLPSSNSLNIHPLPFFPLLPLSHNLPLPCPYFL